MKTQIHAILLICLPLFCVGCMSENIDVSTNSPYSEVIGSYFKTKGTCKLLKFDSWNYLVSEPMQVRVNNGLQNVTGAIKGTEGIDYIREGNTFKIVKIIRKKSFEMDNLSVIGYFSSLNKCIDVGYLFNTMVGEPIKINDKYLEPVDVALK